MRHKIAGRKLGRTSSHRKALFANLATQLIQHEQIQTTLPKAKDLRRVVEPLINKAIKGDVAARREVAKVIKDAAVLKKLFDEVAPRFKDTPGGYTRVLKMGYRQGDSAAMALIELTEGKAHTPKKKAAPKAEKKEAAPKQEEKPAEEVVEAAAEETKEAAPAEEAPVEAASEEVAADAEEEKKD